MCTYCLIHVIIIHGFVNYINYNGKRLMKTYPPCSMNCIPRSPDPRNGAPWLIKCTLQLIITTERICLKNRGFTLTADGRNSTREKDGVLTIFFINVPLLYCSSGIPKYTLRDDYRLYNRQPGFVRATTRRRRRTKQSHEC